MSEHAQQAVDRTVGAWEAVSAEERERLEAAGLTSSMCILASGVCHEILKGRFELELEMIGADLHRQDPGSDETVEVVVHPEGQSAITPNGYEGHVVLIVTEGATTYLVDPDLGLSGAFTGGFATVKHDEHTYWHAFKPDRREFLDTDAWAQRGRVAGAIDEHLEDDNA